MIFILQNIHATYFFMFSQMEQKQVNLRLGFFLVYFFVSTCGATGLAYVRDVHTLPVLRFGFLVVLFLPFGYLVKATEGVVDRAIVGVFEGHIVVIEATEGFADQVVEGNTGTILH